MLMLERDTANHAFALPVHHVVVAVIKQMRPQSPQHGGLGRKRSNRATELKRFLVVRFNLAVGLAVVETDMEVAVVRRQVVVERRAGVRRREKALTLREHGSLESVPVNVFL